MTFPCHYDEQIPARLREADALLTRARAAMPQDRAAQEELLLDFLARFTSNSAGIEGVTATVEETARILRGYDVPSLPLETKVQLTGYRDAFYYMRNCLHARQPLTQDMIRMLHFIATPMGDDQRGRYRDVQIHLAIRTQVPPEPEEVPAVMDGLMAAYEQQRTLHPLLLAAWFHLAHESIHPLHLANGRVERLLVSYLLMGHGYFPVCVKVADRPRYLHAFDVYYETGDITPMAEYIIALEIEELRNCLNR